MDSDAWNRRVLVGEMTSHVVVEQESAGRETSTVFKSVASRRRSDYKISRLSGPRLISSVSVGVVLTPAILGELFDLQNFLIDRLLRASTPVK